MADEDLRREWDAIKDPVKMLEAILKHEDFLGYDPYYKDLRQSLMSNAERVVRESKDAESKVQSAG